MPFSAGAAEADVSPAGTPDSYTDIHIGDSTYKNFENDEIAYYKFVPEQDMSIVFYSRMSFYAAAYLYDAEMNIPAYFKIPYDVTAGNTYYFGVDPRTSNSFIDIQLKPLSEIKVGETAAETFNRIGDYVYYKFVPEHDMWIDFNVLSNYSNTAAYLYDADMKQLTPEDDLVYDREIVYNVTAGNTYYFGVLCADSADVQLKELVFTEIKAGETAKVTIDKGGDIAYFKFVPEKDMKIDFTSLSDEDTYANLYGSAMNWLASDNNSGSGKNFKITYDVNAGTTYFFGARFYSGSSTGSFDVQLQEHEYPEIKVGETVTATIENGGDIAYFKFVPEKDMKINFTSLSDNDTYGYLYDAEMTQLASDDNRGSGNNFKITYDVTAGTTYFFGAKFNSGSSTGSFDVQLQEYVYPEIKVGETATAAIENVGDIAYYKFVPEKDMWIVFTSLSETDTTGYLYDADMTQLASDYSSGSGSNFKITYEVTAGTTYYFGAKFESYSTGSFEVQLQELVCHEIKFGETATVTIENGGDVYYFKFVPEQDMRIVFTSLSDEDTTGCLYDADMNLLASDDNSGTGSNFKIIYNVTAGKTYYFNAKFKPGDLTGSFDVQLQEPVYPEIVVGETKTVTTTTDEKTALFKFDCKKDMLIDFSADMSWDEWENDRYTYGCLYDANMEKITSNVDGLFAHRCGWIFLERSALPTLLLK